MRAGWAGGAHLLQGPIVRKAAMHRQANADVVRAQAAYASASGVRCVCSRALLRAGDELTKQGLPKADDLCPRVCSAVAALCHYPEALVGIGPPDS